MLHNNAEVSVFCSKFLLYGRIYAADIAFKLVRAHLKVVRELLGCAADACQVRDGFEYKAGHARVYARLSNRAALHIAYVSAEAVGEQNIVASVVVEPVARGKLFFGIFACKRKLQPALFKLVKSAYRCPVEL